jgi:hypothetical protein
MGTPLNRGWKGKRKGMGKEGVMGPGRHREAGVKGRRDRGGEDRGMEYVRDRK